MAAFALRRLVGLFATLAVATLIVFAVHGGAAGRPRPGDARHGGAARHAGGAARQARPRPARAGALRRRGWRACCRAISASATPIPRPCPSFWRERLLVSLPLALMALALTTAIAIPLGACGGRAPQRRGRSRRHVATQLGVAVPNFWFAHAARAALRRHAAVVPAGGFPGWSRRPLAGAEGADPAGGRAGAAAGRRSWPA